ncbi:MAG: hypothetical protein HY746_00405 [Elusimicrobia bacterium]|nr:hypothetical protein [Elusimicrobiota bacterium]
MKKILSGIGAVIFAVSLVCAKDFGKIEDLKSGDFSISLPKEGETPVAQEPAVVEPQQPVVVAPEPQPQVPQDVIYKFQRVKNDLWRLDSDTTWLRMDIDRLEREASRIAQQNTSSPFFSSDLRRMSMDMSRYYNDSQRIAMDIKNLLNIAQKSEELNKLARDMEWDARDLNNRFQFDVQNAAQRLEWTVRRIDPKLIGHDAQWTAMDISRYSRDIGWKTRDMMWDTQELARRTQPDKGLDSISKQATNALPPAANAGAANTLVQAIWQVWTGVVDEWNEYYSENTTDEPSSSAAGGSGSTYYNGQGGDSNYDVNRYRRTQE